MSLRNSLYYILAGNDSEYTIRFDASHPVFAGHFPGHPVVPGACLVQIAEELLSTRLSQKVRFTSVRNLKFRQPVTPDQQVTITFSPSMRGNGGCSFNFQLSIPSDRALGQRTINLISASFTATYMCLDSDL